ncbi:MAG: metal ABC transporter ATP-binding protein [Actinobacteria bacterium]|jgi:ABC-type Mn2+/Zn2+ transport system ATPase subunit|nr:metal ABC transporter ATP-binding protein [Actinomycetota bacterium]
MASLNEPPAVDLAGVVAGYGRAAVLEGIDLRVDSGELVGIVGPSGAGKTTLLRLLTGEAARYDGRVRLFGEDVTARPPRRLGLVPQLGSLDWDFPLRVRQAVLLGLAPETGRVPWFSRPEHRRADAMLDRLGILEYANRPISDLSGGQKQRVLLARALVRDADLLLLDEPTSGVDIATRHDVLHLLGELNADGITIVLTTHDLNWVATHLPRIVCLNRGVVADGPPTQVITTENLVLTYGAPMRVIHDGASVVVVDEEPLVGRLPAAPSDAV